MQQIALPIPGGNQYNYHDFIESECNHLASSYVDNWQAQWGINPYPYSLIIKGPASCGKTFLAKKWAYNSSAIFLREFRQLTEDLLLAHQHFIIEDIEQWDEVKLLHYFNAINEQRKYLLMTMSDDAKIKLADLRSRINSVNVITISPPDEQLKRLLVFKLFSQYSMHVSTNVLEILVKTLPQDFNHITEKISELHQMTLSTGKKLTPKLVREFLATIYA